VIYEGLRDGNVPGAPDHDGHVDGDGPGEGRQPYEDALGEFEGAGLPLFLLFLLASVRQGSRQSGEGRPGD
jgi:hypothetical protein